jgi:hypothetical protein
MSNIVAFAKEVPLARYDRMRQEVAQCASIDEAKDIADKAAALAAYAKQSDDKQLEVWLSEIKLRARIRIGELSMELDKSRGGSNPKATLPDGRKSKSEALRDAGIPTSTANDYEQLSGRVAAIIGDRGKRARKAGEAAADLYFARCRENNVVPKAAELKSEIGAAVEAAVGKSERKPKRQKPKSPARPPDLRWITFIGTIRDMAKEDFDLDHLVSKGVGDGRLLPEDIDDCLKVIDRIQQFVRGVANARSGQCAAQVA